jgi:hypothetical protein
MRNDGEAKQIVIDREWRLEPPEGTTLRRSVPQPSGELAVARDPHGGRDRGRTSDSPRAEACPEFLVPLATAARLKYRDQARLEAAVRNGFLDTVPIRGLPYVTLSDVDRLVGEGNL